MKNAKKQELTDFEPEKLEKTPDKAEGDEETVDESIRIHEAKGDLKVEKPKAGKKKPGGVKAA